MATGEITEFHESQFSTNVELLLDQRGSKLRDAVRMENYKGKKAQAVKQIGTMDVQEVTQRFSDTPKMDHHHTSRWVHPKWWAYQAWFDDFVDGVQMMVNPMSTYSQDAADSFGRRQDDQIINAFFADAYTGEEGTVTTPFDSNQVVDQDVGGASSGLNLKKLRETKKLFHENDVDTKADILYFAIAPEQMDDLLGQTQAVSLDYTNKPALVDGEITSFMGFTFIITNKLPIDTNGYRRCVAWAKSGMVLGVWEGVKSRVKERADKNDVPELLSKSAFNATRIEEKKVVEIKCVET